MNPSIARRGLVAIAVLVVCVVGASGARAQSESEKKLQAKDLFEKATRLYDVGKYGEAINDYEEAYLSHRRCRAAFQHRTGLSPLGSARRRHPGLQELPAPAPGCRQSRRRREEDR